jgi:hypothetical protein
LAHHISELRAQWASTFSRFAHQHRGELAYQDFILSFKEQIGAKANKWLRNSDGKGKYAISVISSMLLPSARRRVYLRFLTNKRRKCKLMSGEFDCPEFERPLFILLSLRPVQAAPSCLKPYLSSLTCGGLERKATPDNGALFRENTQEWYLLNISGERPPGGKAPGVWWPRLFEKIPRMRCVFRS